MARKALATGGRSRTSTMETHRRPPLNTKRLVEKKHYHQLRERRISQNRHGLGGNAADRQDGASRQQDAQAKPAPSIKALADRHAANVLPIIREIRRSGATSLHQIVDALNARGISTPRGGAWYAKSVSNVLART